MLDYTLDVLLIGLIAAIFVEAVKLPIKAAFQKQGLTDNATLQKIFKAIMYAITLIICFAGSCIYFYYFKQVSPFESADIVLYWIGTIGASQSIYMLIETYGRDGIWEIFKALIAKRKDTTDLTQLQKLSSEELAQLISKGIGELYENAPVTEEEIKQILDHIQ
jgi:hypothetical protein